MGQLGTFSYFNTIHSFTVLLDRYYTPLVCSLGFIGNSLSLLVFLMDSKYRSQSASYYLSALALSDTGYLINLFAVWLESVKELVITSDFTCPLVMYLGQVTCFLSIYLIVAFSVERYVAVHFPLARARICTRSKARKIIAVLTVLALLLFSYAWIIAKVVELKLEVYPEDYISEDYVLINGTISVYRCSVPPEYYRVSEIANYLDTCITLVIPFLLISFFNVRIAWSLWKLKDSRRQMMATTIIPSSSPTTSLSINNSSVDTTVQSRLLSIRRSILWKNQNQRKSWNRNRSSITTTTMENVEMTVLGDGSTAATTKPAIVDKLETTIDESPQGRNEDDYVSQSVEQTCNDTSAHSFGTRYRQQNLQRSVSVASSSEMRVTKTLLLVSTVFLVLNLPLHAVRCAQFIQVC